MNRSRSWRVAGWAVLAAGLLAALVIYLRAGAPADDFDESPTKLDLRQMQEIGGEADVLGVEFNSWFAGLWHGRRLGGTVAVLSLAGAGVCFWSARTAGRGE